MTERNLKKELFYYSNYDMEDGESEENIDLEELCILLTELVNRIEEL